MFEISRPMFSCRSYGNVLIIQQRELCWNRGSRFVNHFGRSTSCLQMFSVHTLTVHAALK